MLPTILAVLIIVLFLVIENRGRQGQAARSLDTGSADQRSTLMIGIAFMISMIALVAGVVLNLFSILLIYNSIVGWVGIALAALGVGMRTWANRVLGQFYTRTLRTEEGQRIVQEGPYRLIRHPGYLGTLLLWIGAALAIRNWLTLIVILVVMLIAYTYRISVEEKMLNATFGDVYQAYRKHTWRLLPPIY